ncbi:MAG: tRNA 2-thiouridine(34) synthase MnmA [Clostridia bacterium]|nr:tRNA 2-thiouridine(34) synthase MnmA [Clostridia bacterium]
MKNIKKAIIAMSGGVDSSVAAMLLTNKGVECIGVTMKLISDDTVKISPSCCTDKDIEDAASVCKSLGIEHRIFNFSSNFKEKVVDNFVRCYENGMTPNPCVQCNRHLKFDKLFSEAEQLGADCVVTGHYARVEYNEENGRYLLKKAKDLSKDQTYVLYSLSQKQLSRAYFPLGDMDKSEVRNVALENGFINADKKDSQDICFIKDCKYFEFIESYTGKSYPEGNFVDTDGNVLGKHKGIIRYTVGQGKKLGLILPEPLYVLDVDSVSNTVVLGKSEQLYKTELTAKNINLISVPEIVGEMRVKAKIRYRQTEADATLIQTEADEIKVIFDEPQRAITRGQAVVFYDGETVVGGGTIV